MVIKVSEVLSEERVAKCIDLSKRIIQHWVRSQQVDYIVRSETDTAGKSIEDLIPMYFRVGVPGFTRDISFIDLLVTFNSVLALHHAMTNNNGRIPAGFTYSLPTEFSDAEALASFRQLHIEIGMDMDTEHDTGAAP